MKSYNNMYERIISFDNLISAARKSQRSKRFRHEVALFNLNLEKEILRLQKDLRSFTYQPGEYRCFRVYEPKERNITAAPYRDRIVHHALCNVIEPVWDKCFIKDSYACRKEKGTHRAIYRYSNFAVKNRYVLKCDIVKYFPSIDHEILKGIIRRKVRDSSALRLIDLIIDSYWEERPLLQYFSGDNLFTPAERKKGLPIGNLTSQLFANVYLNGLDHFIKEEIRCKFYLRYMDDFVVFGNDKDELWDIRSRIREYLDGIRLKIHPKKSRVHQTKDGLEFLGFRIFPDKRRIRSENLRKFRKRTKKQKKQYKDGILPLEGLNQSIRSWIAHASHGNSYKLREDIFRDLVFVRGMGSTASIVGVIGTSVFK